MNSVNGLTSVKYGAWTWLAELLPEHDASWVADRYLVGVGTFTPAAAAVVLEQHNAQNRPLGPNVVGRLAQAMSRNLFLLNGETVVFDSSGLLRQGQHRMAACVKSGISFQTFFVCGVDDLTFKSFDQHGKRSFWQILASMGVQNPKVTGAGVYALNKYLIAGEWGGKTGPAPLVDDLLNCYANHHGLGQSAAFARGLGQVVRLLRGAGGVCCLHYLMRRAGHKEKASEFFTSLSSMSIPFDGPWSGARLLAKKLLEDQTTKKGRMPTRTVMALTIKAFNGLVLPKVIGKLAFDVAESFPRISGLGYDDNHLPILHK